MSDCPDLGLPAYPHSNANQGNAALSDGLPNDAEALTVPYSYDGTYSITGAFASTGCGLGPTSASARPVDGICTFTQEVNIHLDTLSEPCLQPISGISFLDSGTTRCRCGYWSSCLA